MAETHDARELGEAQAAAERDPDFFPLNDLPNDLIVSVFAAAEDPTWARHTFPLVCRAWNELYRSKNASPLHATLEVDFEKEAAAAEASSRAAAARAASGAEVARAAAGAEVAAAESESEPEEEGEGEGEAEEEGEESASESETESEEDDEEEEYEVEDGRPVVHASRVISWAKRRAGSVHKLALKVAPKRRRWVANCWEFNRGTLKDFSQKDFGALVAVVGSSLTEISIGRNLMELCQRPLWKSLRTSVFRAGRLRSLVVEDVDAVVKESDLELLGQLAGSLEELVLSTGDDIGRDLREVLSRFPEPFLALKKLRRLVLSGHQHITAIPAEISSLEKLEDLELRRCRLSSLPKELGELSGLTKLDLSGNTTLGTTAEAFPAELGEMKSLRHLGLEKCGLRTVPSFVFELTSLESLILHNNRFSSLPEELGELSALTKLDLSSNQNLGTTLPAAEACPAELRKMRSLRELSLDNCGLSVVPAFVGELTSLEVLILSKCRLRTVPSFVGELKSLESLTLHKNDLSSVPKELGELSGLTKLDLSSNGRLRATLPADEAFPAELRKMRSLRELSLDNCGLSVVPAFVFELTSLEVLILSKCRLRTVPAFVGELKSLESLDLSWNSLSSLPKELGELSGLTKLDLSCNTLPAAEAFPAELGKMKSLRELDLGGCGLRAVPSFVGKLKSLVVLDLRGNDLSSLPKELGELSALTKLDLRFNKNLGTALPSAEAFPAELGRMKSLRDLKLVECGLTAIPAFVGGLESLESLTLMYNYHLKVDAPLDFLVEGCPLLRKFDLDNYAGHYPLKTRVKLKVFKANVLARNPNAHVSP